MAGAFGVKIKRDAAQMAVCVEPGAQIGGGDADLGEEVGKGGLAPVLFQKRKERVHGERLGAGGGGRLEPCAIGALRQPEAVGLAPAVLVGGMEVAQLGRVERGGRWVLVAVDEGVVDPKSQIGAAGAHEDLARHMAEKAAVQMRAIG